MARVDKLKKAKKDDKPNDTKIATKAQEEPSSKPVKKSKKADATKKSKAAKRTADDDFGGFDDDDLPMDESDTFEDTNGFKGFSAAEGGEVKPANVNDESEKENVVDGVKANGVSNSSDTTMPARAKPKTDNAAAKRMIYAALGMRPAKTPVAARKAFEDPEDDEQDAADGGVDLAINGQDELAEDDGEELTTPKEEAAKEAKKAKKEKKDKKDKAKAKSKAAAAEVEQEDEEMLDEDFADKLTTPAEEAAKDAKEAKKAKKDKKGKTKDDVTDDAKSSKKRKADDLDERSAKKSKDADRPDKKAKVVGDKTTTTAAKDGKGGKTSKEAHAEQRKVAKERRDAKPNAEEIQRAKKIWERLRVKSKVAKKERQELIVELLDILSGRIKEFVFRHDSVRPIQCALKYGNPEQRKSVALELKGEYKALAESKYGKFLVGKLIVEGDADVRSLIIEEFYGSAQRLINHPEASWIIDDIYRQMASPQQKAVLLREWYGPEFAVLTANSTGKKEVTSELSTILEESPEKRQPIMNHLNKMINHLVQKKMTGFTMLHDAMLQYYINTVPSSSEANEFVEMLKDDEEGDLLKNLAFTKSGSRVVSLVIAQTTAKDRRHLLKHYKDHIDMMANDANAYKILLATMDCIDDTKMTSKLIFTELFGKGDAEEAKLAQQEQVLALTAHPTARTLLMYPLSGGISKTLKSNKDLVSLFTDAQKQKQGTSKKDDALRRKELAQALAEPLLNTIAARAYDLAFTDGGYELITESFLSCSDSPSLPGAIEAVAALAGGSPREEGHIGLSAGGGRMLKSLASGGRFNTSTKSVELVEPRVQFADALWSNIAEHVVDWATGESSFVVVSLLESEDFPKKDELKKALKDKKALKKVQDAAEGKAVGMESRAETGGNKIVFDEEAPKQKKKKRTGGKGATKPKVEVKGNPGAKILLQKLK